MPDREPPLQVDVVWDGVVAKVTVTGELDMTTASTLCRHLLNTGAEHPARLVLDLDGLELVDAAGARALDHVCFLLESDCPVIVRGPRPLARRGLHLSGLMDE